MKNIILAVRKILHAIGVDLVRHYPPYSKLPEDFDEVKSRIIRQVRPFTMTSNERIGALCDAVNYVCDAGIPGAIVECGVWRGGSVMAVAHALLARNEADRELFLFDTFEGMTPPTQEDVDPSGIPATELFGFDGRSGPSAGVSWAPESVAAVQEAVASTGYDRNLCHFIKGKVEETVPSMAPGVISILRLDTDWYESTKHELDYLVPRIADGGVLIIDDYGYWRGSKKAVDEYFRGATPVQYMHRIDESARMFVLRKG